MIHSPKEEADLYAFMQLGLITYMYSSFRFKSNPMTIYRSSKREKEHKHNEMAAERGKVVSSESR